MSEVDSAQLWLRETDDDEVVQYRSVSALAVAGFIVGLFAPVAFIHPLLWTVPLAGLVLSTVALVRIARRESALVGRWPAVAGLLLSWLWGAAAPSEWLAHRLLVDAEARQFATIWFDFVRANEPHKAAQLTQSPHQRYDLDGDVWEAYPPDSDERRGLWQYVQDPPVRALLALGERAHPRYYDTETIQRSAARDRLVQVWAVSYDDTGRRKSFFVRLTLEREILPSAGLAFWTLVGVDGGLRPKALGGE
jgi:hypothetical protein